MPLKPNAYPAPGPYTYPIPPIHPILPVYPPPLTSEYLPPLPSPQRAPGFLRTPEYQYELSTHLFPASYLRTTRHVTLPELPLPLSPNATPGEKEARKRKLKETRDLLDDLRGSKSTDGYPRVLWNCVNRYVRVGPKSREKGLTLFFAHANGFPKEIFEPTISNLLSSSGVPGIVDEIWVWESIQHGDAALVNGSNLSALFDWHDNARDILNFLLYFLPSSNSSSAQPEKLPTHLPKIPEALTHQRLSQGFKGTDERRLVAIGHSYGGCTSALAATVHPNLFTALYLVDPVVIEPRHDYSGNNEQNMQKYKIERSRRPDLAMGALSRRNGWASREQAHSAFLSNPFFAAWDPQVLKTYVECGLYQSQNQVTLKCAPILEASVFAEIHTEHEVFHLLSSLPDQVCLRWCMPGKPGAPQLGYAPLGPGSSEEQRREVESGIARRVWVRRSVDGEETTTTNLTVCGGGHLIPQEAPQELAEDLAAYLIYMYPLWMQSKPDMKSASGIGFNQSSSLKANL